jgi:hypothetical protein
VKPEDGLRDAFETGGVRSTVTLAIVRESARREVRAPVVEMR